MRGVAGFVRRGFIIQQAANRQQQQQFVIPSRQQLSQTSWLSSSAASSSGSGGSKRDGHQLSGINNNNNNNSSVKNSKKSVLKSPSPFKKMTDAVRDKAARLRSSVGGSGGGGGDRVSSDQVKHDRSSKRFTLDLGNNKVARIDYKSMGQGNTTKIEMYHSEVPVELRGRGLGKALARGALEQAARENMRVKLTCTYLIDYVNKSNDPNLKKTLV